MELCNPDFIRKTLCYIKISKKDLPYLQKIKQVGKRNIWRNPEKIDLEMISSYFGYTDGRAVERPFSFAWSFRQAQRPQPQSCSTFEISDFVDTLSSCEDGLDYGVVHRRPTLPQPRRYAYPSQNEHQNYHTLQTCSSYQPERPLYSFIQGFSATRYRYRGFAVILNLFSHYFHKYRENIHAVILPIVERCTTKSYEECFEILRNTLRFATKSTQ